MEYQDNKPQKTNQVITPDKSHRSEQMFIAVQEKRGKVWETLLRHTNETTWLGNNSYRKKQIKDVYIRQRSNLGEKKADVSINICMMQIRIPRSFSCNKCKIKDHREC